MVAPVTVACYFPLGYFFLLVPLGVAPAFLLFTSPPSFTSNECTYVPRREDYSSSPIPLQRAICRDRGELGSETRSIILDHAYWIAAAHSASPDHPRAILGHSRDFHSSGERSTHAPRNLEKLNTT